MTSFLRRNSTSLELMMRVVDVATLIFAGELASAIHFNKSIDQLAQIHSILLYFCSFFAFIVFEKMGVYRSWRGRRPSRMIGNIVISWMLALATGLLFSFLIHQSGEVSRLWFLYWFLAGSSLVLADRWLIHSALRKIRQRGRNKKRVVIVGYGTSGQELHRRAMTQNWYGYDVLAIYAEGNNSHDSLSKSVRILRSLEELPQFAELNHIDEIWIALPSTSQIRPERLQYLLRNVLADIRWVPDTSNIRMLSSDMVEFLGFPTVELNRPISSGLYGIGKDLFDRLFALVVVILLVPIFIPIAIRIKADSTGPILFKR